MRCRRFSQPTPSPRTATTAVEMAVVVPVFGIFLAGIMEFGHAYLVVGTLNSAAKQSARFGAVENVTTAAVLDKADSILSGAIDTSNATFYVKDASVFDSDNVSVGEIDYTQLPDIELADAEPRQLYVVRIEVPYDNVALLPPFWAKDITLFGQSVMRHE